MTDWTHSAPPPPPTAYGQNHRNSRLVFHVAYASLAVSLIGPAFMMLLTVILAYAQGGRAKQTALAGHSGWLAGTFWWAVALGVLGWLLTPLLIGWPILGLVWLWTLYRVIRGWLALANDNSP